MNVGDIVKITSKHNPDMFMSGIVKTLEDENVWGSAKTMLDYDLTLNTENYDIEVIRQVEPREIGTIYSNNKGFSYVRFSNSDSGFNWIEVGFPIPTPRKWDEIK